MDFAAIDERGEITPEQFESIRIEAKPVILRGLVKDWPAVNKAQHGDTVLFDYLKSFDNGQLQNTLIGAPELQGKFNYNSDFSGQNYTHRAETVGAALDALLDNTKTDNAPATYIQSILIKDHLPNFISVHNMPFVPEGTPPRAWIGNKTVVQTHFDLSENIACVVAGEREFTLFPPDQLPNLYIGPLESAPGGTPVSTTNLDQPDFNAHPGFETALKTATRAQLKSGDAIYIPAGWFHHVRALSDINMLVNYWWSAPGAQVSNGWAAVLHAIMAFRGLPASERAMWQGIFAQFAFGQDGDAMAHLPDDRRGVLGGVPDTYRESNIRQILQSLGGDIGLSPPPRK